MYIYTGGRNSTCTAQSHISLSPIIMLLQGILTQQLDIDSRVHQILYKKTQSGFL